MKINIKIDVCRKTRTKRITSTTSNTTSAWTMRYAKSNG